MKSRSPFVNRFPAQHNLLAARTTPLLTDSVRALDIGAGSGFLAEIMMNAVRMYDGAELVCIDKNAEAMVGMTVPARVKLECRAGNVNDMRPELNKKPFDLVFCSSSVHELDPEPYTRWAYIMSLAEIVQALTRPGAHWIIGDWYYPIEGSSWGRISAEEAERYRDHLMQELGHADHTSRFLEPRSLIWAITHQNKFEWEGTYEIPAECRNYYVTLFKRK